MCAPPMPCGRQVPLAASVVQPVPFWSVRVAALANVPLPMIPFRLAALLMADWRARSVL